jgi:hypothetical protein
MQLAAATYQPAPWLSVHAERLEALINAARRDQDNHGGVSPEKR